MKTLGNNLPMAGEPYGRVWNETADYCNEEILPEQLGRGQSKVLHDVEERS